MLSIVERKLLRLIQGPINELGIWRRWYNNEIYQDFDDIEIVRHVKIGASEMDRTCPKNEAWNNTENETKWNNARQKKKRKTQKQVNRRNRRGHKNTGGWRTGNEYGE